MDANNVLKDFICSAKVRAMASKVASLQQADAIYAEGLHGSAAACVMSALYKQRQLEKNFLVILNDQDEAGYFYNDIINLLGQESAVFFPSPYKRGVKYAQVDAANEILRTDVLSKLARCNGEHQTGISPFIVTYPEALSVKVVNSNKISQNLITIRQGESIDFAELEKDLLGLGFVRADYVYQPGEFAVRGSIMDVFSYSSEYPYRIDFFGDDIDSIRTFDVQSQLSVEKVEEATIVPLLASPDDVDRVPFFSLLPKNTVVVQSNPTFVCASIERIYNEGFSNQAVIERRQLAATQDRDESDLNSAQLLLDSSEYSAAVMRFPSIILSAAPLSRLAASELAKTFSFKFDMQPQPLFHKNFEILTTTLSDYIKQQYKVYLFADSPKQHERLKSIFEHEDNSIDFVPIDFELHSGFIDADTRCCLFTDHQIFDRFHRYQLRNTHANDGKVALSLKDINHFEPGDYVTHVDHGVGQFVGLIRVNEGAHEQEMMKLLYKNGDIVYVSVHSLSKVSKYKSKDGEQPRLSRLGTGAWSQMKERTKTKIKDIARDLIKLYSERRKHEGYSFSPDSYMQHELEASFVYEDTPDQLKVTREIKKDMESRSPMDRLVCGDVGFGKTELAVRAALKAACDSKQVAVLVPTTILAYQHYNTFRERLKDFPVTVEYLSRAQTLKKTKEICERLAQGKIEILIGTHKLLGKSVKFKDLGLLIVDEEQKFGVATKEKLRQLKVNVDTLTLTATPIPRTLQFSLMGARDLSVLQTPPSNRFPIHTEIHTFNHEIIADAINFEMSRGGQVFFVTNRIASLPHIESVITKHVPDARVAMGHGRMSPEQLEHTLSDFIEGKYDVLLSTTIVENGIDIPNVNTIIIDNAHNFGLSDLHQMRGRVGRSTKKAFCYLLTPPLSCVSPDSRRRLEAIENFSDLGSGIQIAMQDLDIRGAGNLLGAEQSGFIADLGYETYQKILSEAVQELKNDEFADLYADEVKHTNSLQGELFVEDCVIESDLPLFLPEEYIPGNMERVQCYREIDNLATDKQLSDYRNHLLDRFGKLPQPAEGLLKVPIVRRRGRSLGMERIVARKGLLTMYFVSNMNSAYYQSDTFGRVIAYMTHHFKSSRLSEVKGKRRMVVEGVKDIEAVLDVLAQISAEDINKVG